MTDKEIIKVLENLLFNRKCKIAKSGEQFITLGDILDLINRQQSAIDVYMQENDKLKTLYIQVSEDRNEIQKEAEAEIERLTKECGNQSALWSKHYEDIFETAKETVKTEAIKEFAERLCEGRASNDPVVIAVKCELEEWWVRISER